MILVAHLIIRLINFIKRQGGSEFPVTLFMCDHLAMMSFKLSCSPSKSGHRNFTNLIPPSF